MGTSRKRTFHNLESEDALDEVKDEMHDDDPSEPDSTIHNTMAPPPKLEPEALLAATNSDVLPLHDTDTDQHADVTAPFSSIPPNPPFTSPSKKRTPRNTTRREDWGRESGILLALQAPLEAHFSNDVTPSKRRRSERHIDGSNGMGGPMGGAGRVSSGTAAEPSSSGDGEDGGGPIYSYDDAYKVVVTTRSGRRAGVATSALAGGKGAKMAEDAEVMEALLALRSSDNQESLLGGLRMLGDIATQDLRTKRPYSSRYGAYARGSLLGKVPFDADGDGYDEEMGEEEEEEGGVKKVKVGGNRTPSKPKAPGARLFSPRRKGHRRPPPPPERNVSPNSAALASELVFLPFMVHHPVLQGARTKPRKTLPEPFPWNTQGMPAARLRALLRMTNGAGGAGGVGVGAGGGEGGGEEMSEEKMGGDAVLAEAVHAPAAQSEPSSVPSTALAPSNPSTAAPSQIPAASSAAVAQAQIPILLPIKTMIVVERHPRGTAVAPAPALHPLHIFPNPEENLNHPASTTDDAIAPVDAAPSELALRNALGSSRVRRWIMYEWMYSAIDRPWFMHSPLSDFCRHIGLPPTTLLTRREWAAIRAGMKRPGTKTRRLSLAFLREERSKLKEHREAVRGTYLAARARAEDSAALPLDCPRPLAVGQRIVAQHPRTRLMHDGTVLTANLAMKTYLVLFDRQELGSHHVRDVDIMPECPFDYLPPTVQHALLTEWNAEATEMVGGGEKNGAKEASNSDGENERGVLEAQVAWLRNRVTRARMVLGSGGDGGARLALGATEQGLARAAARLDQGDAAVKAWRDAVGEGGENGHAQKLHQVGKQAAQDASASLVAARVPTRATTSQQPAAVPTSASDYILASVPWSEAGIVTAVNNGHMPTLQAIAARLFLAAQNYAGALSASRGIVLGGTAVRGTATLLLLQAIAEHGESLSRQVVDVTIDAMLSSLRPADGAPEETEARTMLYQRLCDMAASLKSLSSTLVPSHAFSN